MPKIMLDTNILSIAYLPRPPEWIWEWLESLPRGSIAIPWCAIYEIEYGIRVAQRQKIRKAVELLAWFEEFLETRIALPEMDVNAARLLGRMAAEPPLRRFFTTGDKGRLEGDIRKHHVRLGVDPMLAALSISHQIPLATLNLRDFMYIHRYFPIPGVYSPEANAWVIEPPLDWRIGAGANDDLPGHDTVLRYDPTMRRW